jgi:predicted secreted hydrolase
VRSSRARALAAAAVLAGLGALALWWTAGPGGPGARARREATVAVAEALARGDTAGFARASAPRPFEFPRDHGPHPDFRTEWWYYTGNLTAEDGRHFGFQLTFFRQALAPPDGGAAAARASAWATRQLYVAHFALTDTAGGRFHAVARASRGALGLAGAAASPFRVWLEDWSAASAGDGALPVRLRAAEGDRAIDLVLESAKPVVLQGDRGRSRKGPDPGDASYYYSLTRMPARGTVTVGGRPVAVTGAAWMDREWSTSALGPALVGWDWFALQLDDGRELMLYRLRRRDGGVDPHSAGTLVDARGAARALGAADVRVEVRAEWTSPRSAVRYPSAWRLRDAAGTFDLDVRPRLADQELLVGTRYWEGAVVVTGTAAGRSITGQGYAELVGYGE